MSGDAALPVEVLRGFEAVFGRKLLEGYGVSETSPVISFNHADRERKPGSIRTPIAGVEIKLIDDDSNEVDASDVGAVRGHNVMKGYWRRPEATASAIDAEAWFHTGDMARLDDDGYCFIVDRKQDNDHPWRLQGPTDNSSSARSGCQPARGVVAYDGH